MKPSCHLNGLRVLNTRPEHQATPLNTLISSAQGVAVPLPLMKIKPLDAGRWIQTLPPLESLALAIFTSVNAVNVFFEGFHLHRRHWPLTLQTIAIGHSTAQALKNHGITALFPMQHDSEHLLSLPPFARINRQSVLIIKGEHGRQLIQQTLKQNNVILYETAVYRRERNHSLADQCESIWQNDAVDIILGTSQFSIETLFSLVSKDGKKWLRNKPWIVFSQRLKDLTQQMGGQNIWVSENSRLLETLYQFSQGLTNDHKER